MSLYTIALLLSVGFLIIGGVLFTSIKVSESRSRFIKYFPLAAAILFIALIFFYNIYSRVSSSSIESKLDKYSNLLTATAKSPNPIFQDSLLKDSIKLMSLIQSYKKREIITGVNNAVVDSFQTVANNALGPEDASDSVRPFWVYVGQVRDSSWITKYFKLDSSSGSVKLYSLASVFKRDEVPYKIGEPDTWKFGNIIGTVKPGTGFNVIKIDTLEANNYWALVKTPGRNP